jgi:hypothetical protein
VAAGEDGGERALHDFRVAHDDLADFRAKGFPGLPELVDGFLGGHKKSVSALGDYATIRGKSQPENGNV